MLVITAIEAIIYFGFPKQQKNCTTFDSSKIITTCAKINPKNDLEALKEIGALINGLHTTSSFDYYFAKRADDVVTNLKINNSFDSNLFCFNYKFSGEGYCFEKVPKIAKQRIFVFSKDNKVTIGSYKDIAEGDKIRATTISDKSDPLNKFSEAQIELYKY